METRKNFRVGSWQILVTACLFVVSGVACSEDEPPPPPLPAPNASAPKAPRAGAAAGAKKRKGKRLGYAKIEDEYRRELKGSDFRPDPSGNANRDPFRSFVLDPEDLPTTDIPTTDVCKNREWLAPEQAVNSLSLTAIVLQGTRSWAQFLGGNQLGHNVRRGDCLGKEKAVVAHIGDNFVRLEITPEAPPGAATPEPQMTDVPLYPAETDLAR